MIPAEIAHDRLSCGIIAALYGFLGFVWGVGVGQMRERKRWAPVIRSFMAQLAALSQIQAAIAAVAAARSRFN